MNSSQVQSDPHGIFEPEAVNIKIEIDLAEDSFELQEETPTLQSSPAKEEKVPKNLKRKRSKLKGRRSNLGRKARNAKYFKQKTPEQRAKINQKSKISRSTTRDALRAEKMNMSLEEFQAFKLNLKEQGPKCCAMTAQPPNADQRIKRPQKRKRKIEPVVVEVGYLKHF